MRRVAIRDIGKKTLSPLPYAFLIWRGPPISSHPEVRRDRIRENGLQIRIPREKMSQNHPILRKMNWGLFRNVIVVMSFSNSSIEGREL